MKQHRKLPLNTILTELTVTDLNQKGQGICRFEGRIIFADGAVPGDMVDVKIITSKTNYAVGKVVKFHERSPMRVKPACPYYKHCGGCQLQHIEYAAELKFKHKTVADALKHIGGIADADAIVKPVLGMAEPTRYRNKAQYKVCSEGTGFYKRDSHQVIPIDRCLIQPECSDAVIRAINAFIEKTHIAIYDETTGKGDLRGVIQRTNYRDELMLTLILKKEMPKQVRGMIDHFTGQLPKLVSLNININAQKGNVIFGNTTRCIWGKPVLEEMLNGLIFTVSPKSFFQVNRRQTEILYRQVQQCAAGCRPKIIYDLFCGTGTIGLHLAREAEKIIGIEMVEEAVADAEENAKRNHIDNAVFHAGKAEVVIDTLIHRGEAPDLVVVDPPRKGIDRHIIELLAEKNVPNIIYVSCDPATLARDVALFREKGYELKSVQPVDMFPRTGHVESVVLMSKGQIP